MNKFLLKKVEELTLHLIEKDKEIDWLQKEISDSKIESTNKISEILQRLAQLEKVK